MYRLKNNFINYTKIDNMKIFKTLCQISVCLFFIVLAGSGCNSGESSDDTSTQTEQNNKQSSTPTAPTPISPSAKKWSDPVGVSSQYPIGGYSYTMDDEGYPVVVWAQDDSKVKGVSQCKIYFSRHVADKGWTSPQMIITPSGFNPSNPRIIFNSKGDGLINWEGSSSSNNGVWVAQSSPKSGWSAPLRLDSPDDGKYAGNLVMYSDENDDFMAAWQMLIPKDDKYYEWQRLYSTTDGWGEATHYSYSTLVYKFDKEGNGVHIIRDGWAIKCMMKPAGGYWGEPILFDDNQAEICTLKFTYDSKGNALLTWDRFICGKYQTHYSYYKKATSTWTKPDQLFDDGRIQSIAFDGNEDAIVLYTKSINHNNHLFTLKLQHDKMTWNTHSLNDITGTVNSAGLAAFPDGRVLAVFDETGETTTLTTIWAKWYDPSSGWSNKEKIRDDAGFFGLGFLPDKEPFVLFFDGKTSLLMSSYYN
jgi:hypothetical protein